MILTTAGQDLNITVTCAYCKKQFEDKNGFGRAICCSSYCHESYSRAADQRRTQSKQKECSTCGTSFSGAQCPQCHPQGRQGIQIMEEYDSQGFVKTPRITNTVF